MLHPNTLMPGQLSIIAYEQLGTELNGTGTNAQVLVCPRASIVLVAIRLSALSALGPIFSNEHNYPSAYLQPWCPVGRSAAICFNASYMLGAPMVPVSILPQSHFPQLSGSPLFVFAS